MQRQEEGPFRLKGMGEMVNECIFLCAQTAAVVLFAIKHFSSCSVDVFISPFFFLLFNMFDVHVCTNMKHESFELACFRTGVVCGQDHDTRTHQQWLLCSF